MLAAAVLAWACLRLVLAALARLGLWTRSPQRALAVFGSGGHTTELVVLIKQGTLTRAREALFVHAATDSSSRAHIDALRSTKSPNVPDAIHVASVPRSREVAQSYASSVVTTAYASVHALVHVARFQPDLVLVNGPGTCLPYALAAIGLRTLGLLPGVRVVYVESIARVHSLSLTGKLLRPFVDQFHVQWPQLLTKLGQSAFYHGSRIS